MNEREVRRPPLALVLQFWMVTAIFALITLKWSLLLEGLAETITVLLGSALSIFGAYLSLSMLVWWVTRR